jgi:hypothetical protein
MCNATTPIVPDELIDALEAVLACLWSAEFDDYHANGGDAHPDAGQHLFPRLEVIRHWLDYVEEDCGRG